MPPDKRSTAVKFLNDIRTMEPRTLNDLILQDAGAELAEFFVSYCTHLFAQAPDKAAENASSLMLMGYLIRANEGRAQAAQA